MPWGGHRHTQTKKKAIQRNHHWVEDKGCNVSVNKALLCSLI